MGESPIADYNLGTAHGKIVVDYNDRGSRRLLADLSRFRENAGRVASAGRNMAKRWRSDLSGMSDDTTKFARNLAVATGAATVLARSTMGIGGAMAGLRGVSTMWSGISMAMGGVPKEAEKFPRVVRNIIQIAAALGVVSASLPVLGKLVQGFFRLNIVRSVFGNVTTGLLRMMAPLRRIPGLQVPVLAMMFRIRSASDGLIGALGNSGRAFNALGSTVSSLARPFAFVATNVFRFITIMGAFKVVKQAIKPLLIMQGALGAVGVAVQALGWIWGAAHELIAATVGILPLAIGGLLGLAAAAGVAFIGFKGFGEALKSGDISKLHVEAGKAVTTIRSMSKEWSNFQKTIQGRLFAGMGKELERLKGILAQLTPTAGKVADAFNGIFKQLVGWASAETTIGNMISIMEYGGGIIRNLGAALVPLLRVLMNVGVVGAKVFEEMTRGAGGAMLRFDAFIAKARETGQLEQWIKNGVQAFKDMWAVLVNLKNILDTVFKGLGGSEFDGFWASAARGTAALNEFLKSAQGQEVLGTLATMIDHAQENLKRFADVFMSDVFPAIQAFLPYLQTMSDAIMTGIVVAIKILAPQFKMLGEALSFLAPIIAPIAGVFAGLAVLLAGQAIFWMILSKNILLVRSAFGMVRAVIGGTGLVLRLLSGNLMMTNAQFVKHVAVSTWAAITTAAKWVWAKIVIVAQWIWMGVMAVVNAIKTAATWIVQTTIATARIVIAWVITRLQIFVIWASLVLQSAISSLMAFVSWAVQATIQTAAMIMAWVLARVRLMIEWLMIRTMAMINAIGAFIVWVVQSAIATAQMIIAWVIARTRLMIEWMLIKVMAMVNAIGAFLVWVVQSTIATAQMVIQWVIARATLVAQWVMMKVAAMANAVGMAAAWVVANGPAIAAFIARVIATAVMYVIQWVIMAAGAMASAIAMAAAWFVALGPIGWVIAAVVGLVILIIANWDRVKSFTMSVWNAIVSFVTSVFNRIVTAIASGIARAVAFLVAGWMRARMAVTQAWAAMVAAVAAGVARVIGFVQSLPGRIQGFFAAAGRWLLNAGRAIMDGLLNGIKAAWEAVAGFLSGLAGKIASLKGPLPKDRKLLIPAGIAIMKGLREGLQREMPNLVRDLKGITKTIAGTNAGIAVTAGAKGTGIAGAKAATDAVSTWNPYARPTGGGVQEQSPTVNDFSNMSVTIDGKTVETMQKVEDFFGAVEQTARAGKAS